MTDIHNTNAMPIAITDNVKSNNFDDTPHRVKYLIVHCIGYSAEHALRLLTKSVADGGSGAGSHYFIPQHPPIQQLIADHHCAHHAGISHWRQDSQLNAHSIGIEFHNPNYANALSDTLDWLHFEAFPAAQINAGITLLQMLINKYAIAPENILGHSDIAAWRPNAAGEIILGKTDPGATFPWQTLARAGVGVWPKTERTRSTPCRTDIPHVQQLLKEYGYALDVNGQWDMKTRCVVRAFQWHFLPDGDGRITEKMVIALENLLDREWIV